VPILTEDEICAQISTGVIFAIALDTQVFDRHQNRLDAPALQALKQFKETPVRVFIPQIVASECLPHLTSHLKDSQRDLAKALETYTKYWPQAHESIEALGLNADPASQANEQFQTYLDDIGAEILPTDPTVTDEVLNRYFNILTPFESNAKKKHEFPDAFALLTLEQYASSEGRQILCVSGDRGWHAFATQSASLACVEDLKTALSYFNQADGQPIADRVMAHWLAHTEEDDFVAALLLEIEILLESAQIEVAAECEMEWEADPHGVVLQHIDLTKAQPALPISMSDDDVTFVVELPVLVNFTSNFEFFIYDGVDKDYVEFGSEEFEKEQFVDISLTITVERDIAQGPNIVSCEATLKNNDIDFGYLQPFRDDDPTFEKY
jgi:predicted nucleic acid-binding protein